MTLVIPVFGSTEVNEANLDGGGATSSFLPTQNVDGGSAESTFNENIDGGDA